MADIAKTAADALKRLGRNDATLKKIDLREKHHTDAQLAELVDCLLAHPNVVVRFWLAGNRLTDETGVKLARCLAASSTVYVLNLSNNQLGEATYLALAAALSVNTSLKYLDLYGNQAVDRTRVDAAFVEALRLNPDRPAESRWWLYERNASDTADVDFKRLVALAQPKSGFSLFGLFGRPTEASTSADERVQQLRERDQAAAGMQAQIRDVQAMLEATQRQLEQERQAKSAAQAQLAEERQAKLAAQAQVEQVQGQCIRLQQQLLDTQAQLVDLTNAARQHSHGAASSSRADGAAQLGHSTQAVGHRWSELRGGLKTAFELLQAAVSTVDGYALGQRLGSGSNGAVFTVRVLDERLQRVWQQSVDGPFTAALKMQLPSHARTTLANQMFAREYAALQALPLHENICTLYWQFVAEPTDQLINDSFPELDPVSRQAIFFAQNAFTGQLTKRRTQFLVMERYATTLDSYVRERNRELTALDRARLALNVAEGLAHMLAHGWLHLDIKPDNLLLASDGRLVITDFGTSMRMHTGTTTLQFSHLAGLIGGNEGHLSPEAIIGRSNEQPFEAAKQPSWELGCVLWYLITGDEHPYPGYPHGYGADFALLPLLDVRQLCTAIEQANTGPSRLAASAVYTLAALSIALLAGSAQQRPAIADAAAVLRTLPVQ